jgi:hypothetical protein
VASAVVPASATRQITPAGQRRRDRNENDGQARHRPGDILHEVAGGKEAEDATTANVVPSSAMKIVSMILSQVSCAFWGDAAAPTFSLPWPGSSALGRLTLRKLDHAENDPLRSVRNSATP